MATDPSNIAPTIEQLKDLAAFLQQGLFEPEGAAALSERRRIQLCPVCILHSSTVILRANNLEPKDFPKHLFVTDCHDFLVDAMWVLTTLPTADDERMIRPDLRRAYTTCHGQSEGTEIPSDEELLQYFLISLMGIVAICLRFTVKSQAPRWSTRFRTKGTWPTCIPDILPGDSPRSAMFNLLCYWSRHSEAPVCTTVVKGVLLQVPSMFREVAAALMDARPIFLPAYCERFATLGRSLQQLPATGPEFDQAQKNLDEFVAFNLFLSQALIPANVSPRDFIAGHEDQLSAALDEAARGESCLLKPPEVPIAFIRGMFATPNRNSAPEMLASNSLSLPRALVWQLLRPGRDPYTSFYSRATLSARESRCWARGCQQYGQPGASKLMRCARCRVLQYCSRQCQRAHWNDVVRPHKAVCATLARIQEVAPLGSFDDDEQAFSIACRNAGIQVEDLLRPDYYFFSYAMNHDKPDAEGMELMRMILDPPPEWAAIAHDDRDMSDTIQLSPPRTDELSSQLFALSAAHLPAISNTAQRRSAPSRTSALITPALCLFPIILAVVLLTCDVPTWLAYRREVAGNHVTNG